MIGNTSRTSHVTEAFISSMVFQMFVFILTDAKNCQMNIQQSKFELRLILTKAGQDLTGKEHRPTQVSFAKKSIIKPSVVNVTTIL